MANKVDDYGENLFRLAAAMARVIRDQQLPCPDVSADKPLDWFGKTQAEIEKHVRDSQGEQDDA